MSGTPAWLQEKIVAYYDETTKTSYQAWGGGARALHLGLSDDATPIADGDRAGLDRALLHMNEYLADGARIGAGCRVLDAGCGIGGSSVWLATERGATVTGVTLDPGQVELARRFAEERGARGVSFEVMDFAATGLPDASFDVVWNLESLCHCARPFTYLEHVRSLLSDGGRFVCADFFRGDGGDPSDCDEMCEGWVLPDLRRQGELKGALQELGFIAIDVVDITARVLPSAAVMGAIGTSRSFFSKLRTAAGEPPRPIYEGHYSAAAAANRGLRSGAVTYGYVCATRPPRG